LWSPGAALLPVDLEADDAVVVAEGDGRIDVHLALAPRSAGDRPVSRQRRRAHILPDDDELLLADSKAPAAEGRLEIGAPDGGELLYAVGNGTPQPLAGRLDLASLGESAVLSASEPVVCRRPPAMRLRTRQNDEPCAVHLRVWYTPSPRALSREEVDPSIIERLEALGYEW